MERAKSTAIVTVGDEILAGFTLDTNSHHLAARVFAAGYPARSITTIHDDVATIAAAVREAVADERNARVAVCGGLGPTPDDITVEGVAAGVGAALIEHPDAVAQVQARIDLLHERGVLATTAISAANRRMVRAPQGAEILPNAEGMAPGIACAIGADRWLVVLPGVPREFLALVDDVVIPRYFGGGTPPMVEELRYTGIPEAEFADPMTQLAREFPDVVVGSYPQRTRRELLLRFRGANAAHVAAAAARMLELRPQP